MLQTPKVSSPIGGFSEVFASNWRIEEVDGELEAVGVVDFGLIRLLIVELLADLSTPPDANDVLDDEMEIGHCWSNKD